MARLIILLLLADLVLLMMALIDCLSVERTELLPRSGWVFLILLGSPVAAIAWFLAGRAPADRRAGRQPNRVGRQPNRMVTAPDDDPEFLASLDRAFNLRRND